MATLDSRAVHWSALEALEAADMTLAHAPIQLRDDEVHTMDQVTPEWLTKVLGGHIPGARISEHSIIGGHEGMTSRHKWRLVWNSKGQKAGLPKALFFKSTPKDAHLREMLSLLHMAERECHLYNELQDELCDLIPKCYYARSYVGGRHIIILQDMEERDTTTHWMGDMCSIEFAYEVAITLAKIHSRFWNSGRFEGDMVWVRPHCRRFGELWMQKYFEENRRKFLEMDIGKNLPPYVRDLLKQWNENAITVWKYFDTKPQTILHGDSHLGNVMEFGDGSAGLFDWQCLFRGYGYRDLSYFLMSALTVEDCAAHELDIFNTYTNTLEQNGVTVNRDEAWLDYSLLCLDQFDSTISSLTNGGYGHAKQALERQVRTLTAAVQEHDVAALLSQVIRTKVV